MMESVRRAQRLGLVLSEVPRALAEWGGLAVSAPLLVQAPRGDGHTVLVLPGLGAGDLSTLPLRQYLSFLGYRAEPWGLGRNSGPNTPDLQQRLRERVALLAERAPQRPVSLVGWSMGGVYARLLAHALPQQVRQVITLGSPFQFPQGAELPPVPSEYTDVQSAQYWLQRVRTPLPNVPSTAIFSKTDAVVPWHLAIETAGPQAESIEVFTSHLGLGVSSSVLYAVADRLAQAPGQWRPFERSSWRSWVYGAGNTAGQQAQH